MITDSQLIGLKCGVKQNLVSILVPYTELLQKKTEAFMFKDKMRIKNYLRHNLMVSLGDFLEKHKYMNLVAGEPEFEELDLKIGKVVYEYKVVIYKVKFLPLVAVDQWALRY